MKNLSFFTTYITLLNRKIWCFPIRKVYLTLMFILVGFLIHAQNAYYIRSFYEGEPWGKTSNIDAMNTVFGTGGWSAAYFETLSPSVVFSSATCMVFLEGSDQNATELESFLTANLTTIQDWVFAGGHLLINAAPNEDNGMSFGFGDVALVYPYYTPAVQAANLSHPIFNGPFLPVGTVWTGNYFGHAKVTGTGLAPLIVDQLSPTNVVLAEKSWGSGRVLFGGMTVNYFHSPVLEAANLRANIISYLATPFCTCTAGWTVYLDADGDGYGNADNPLFVSDCVAPSGYVYDSTDCNDANASIHPGVDEVVNGIDDNCNGLIDENKWIQQSNFGGTSRYNAVAFSINGKGYFGTGKTSAGAYLKDFWEYDPASDVWTQKANFGGNKRYKATGFAIGTKGYIGTGYDLNGSLVKDFWEYDVATNSWSQKVNFGGTGRQSAVGFAIGTKGYIGSGGDFLGQHNDFWEYDQATNSWLQKANISNISVEGAVGFSIGTKGYIGTGSNSSGYQGLMWEYDQASDTWTQKANFGGTARQGATGFSVNSKGYIGTGYDGSYKNDFWEYDPATDLWTQIASLPGSARANAVGFSVNGTGYIGTGNNASTVFNDVWKYTPAPCVGTTVYADNDGDGFGDPSNSYFAADCVIPNGYISDNNDCDDANSNINPKAVPVKEWDKRYGGSNDDQPTWVINTADGGYIISGISKSPVSFEKSQANKDATNATYDYWILKIDAAGVKQWDKTIGGSGDESAVRVIRTLEGNYLLAGTSSSGISGDKTQASKGLSDFWIVKINSSGTILWDKDYGGSGNETLHQVLRTDDGGFLLGGESDSPISGDKTQGSQGLIDYWIVKIDADGNKLWDKRFGGTKDDILTELRGTSDGFVLGGRSFSDNTGDKTQPNWDATLNTADFWIVKTDFNGNYQWDKRFGGTAEESLFAIATTPENGYLLCGYSKSNISGDKTQNSQGGSDFWVVKLDASQNKIYDVQFGGSSDEQIFLLKAMPDDGYIVGGSSQSGISGDKSQNSQGLRDYWILKADANGVKQWDVRYGGTKNDVPTGLQLTTDGGLIATGNSFSGISGDKSEDNHDPTLLTRDYWVIKLSIDNGYQPFYPDNDGDGYGDEQETFTLACTAPYGFVSDHTDCNDADGTVHPNAADVCNGLDDDCNGLIDENSITATVNPTGPVNVCSGNSILLTANTGIGITYQWKKGNNNINGATNSTYTTNKAGAYKVVESNSFGCSSTSAATTVTIVTSPNATITPQGNLDICIAGFVDLKANAGVGLTYQWKKGNNTIFGATNQTYTATIVGTYKVVVTNSSNCSKTSAGVQVTKSCRQDDTTSEKSSKLSVYPNPTDGRFVIELAVSDQTNAKATIQLINTLGQVLDEKTSAVVNGMLHEEIQFSNHEADGMYMVKVTISDRVYTQQISYQK